MSALSHLTILDLTTRLPGPYCSMILAGFGARVIKVEPPGGDPLRALPAVFESVNRGKQSIVIDLKSRQGQAVLADLAGRTDVMLEGFRPGAAARLGADYETVRACNPSVVYCAISGFGQDGPYRNRAGHDINYQAMGGLLGQAERPAGTPVTPPALIADLASGLYAAVAILAALTVRDATGQGEYIDLSMTESVVSWMAPEIARAFAGDRTPGRPTLSGLPHYGVFETSDGRYLSLGIVYETHFWERLCDTLGLETWRGLTTDERLQRADEIRSRLRRIFRTKPRDEWDRRLREADVPCGPVYTLDELLGDPQLAYRDVFRNTPDGGLQVMPPFRFSRMPPAPSGPPPGLGAHTGAILRELGYAEEKAGKLIDGRVVA